jgi:hypothetical protein
MKLPSLISKIVIGLMALVWFQASLATEVGCSKQEIYQREVAIIQSLSPQNSSGVIFIRALAGYFPLPSRYLLWTPAKDISMSSGLFPFTNATYLNCPNALIPQGAFEIGNISDCEECSISANNKLKHFELIRETKFGELSVKHIKIKLPKTEIEEHILFDDKNFVRFYDDNAFLWDAMWNFYTANKAQ